MSSLALYLLGPPRVERDGKPLEVNRRKALALVAYLAVTGQSHARDSLVTLLWPEYDNSRGRAALRRTLFTLRSALGGDQIEVEGDQLGLRTRSDATSGAALWTDIAQFRQHLAACRTHGHADSEICASCAKPLTDALSLVDGDFMSGFSLKDSFNFDDWQRFEAERLHRELDGALERLVYWHSSQREFEPAVGYAQHRLAIDPLNEGAHRQLMRLHIWAGRRSAALRQYKECVAILKEQLDLPPEEATTALYESIQEGRAPTLPDVPRERESPILCETLPGAPTFLDDDIPVEIPLFVARQRELDRLDRYLQSALDGQGKVVLITGEAGAGKTALIQEFSRRAQDSHPDLVIAMGHCNAHTGIGDPYLPFREILGLLTGDVEAQWAAGAMTREQASRLCDTLPLVAQAIVETGPDLLHTFVLPSALLRRARSFVPHSEDWLLSLEARVAQQSYAGPGTSSPQQVDLFGQFTRVMQALAEHHPLLLVVDDLQWADLGSISLLFHLGRQLADSRLLVVGSYRPEEVALGRSDPRMPSGRKDRHPLEGVINELQRLFGNITVNLGDAEAEEFVDLLLDSEPNQLDTAFRQALHARTQGHPLFTIELLRGLQERGDLVRDSLGRWTARSSLNWEKLPARVEAVIAERISRLAQPLRAALRVASVEGDVFTAEVIAQVQGLEEQGMLRLLSRHLDRRHRLIQAQSIQRAAGQLVSRYRFRHILFQRYIYGSLDEVERVHLHQRIGTALEGLYATQDETVAVTDLATIAPQLARHFQEAKNTEKALHYLHQAGQRAAKLSAYEEAIAHLTRGLDLLNSMPASPERVEWEKTLQLSLGVASKWTLPDPAGETALNRARELCLQTSDTAQLVQVLGELAIFPYVRAEHQ
ncbi:MAG: AAA family ATPase, partial [Anaerolineae bacterium]